MNATTLPIVRLLPRPPFWTLPGLARRALGYHPPMLELRPITDGNLAELQALRVAPHQERFVSTVRDALAEAVAEPEARPITWGVYEGDTPVGFVMIADEVDSEDYIPQYLWKLLIDERYQGRGYGASTLDLIVAYFRSRPGVTAVTTSAGEGDGGPIPFYERYGFVRTGEVHDGEVMLRLDLT
jgi:diamine N-acetyltransferase